MADDLKPMLTRLLASAGKKKFFFAYGLGKRKDGKGDGELVVRGKKIKKPEVEGELVDCKEFLEGVCWSSPEGDTVFFQGKGKKLSPMIVAKMAITAKREAGKQYDFQVPSPEQEAHAEKLAEGEGDGPSPEGTPPSPGATEAQTTIPTGKVAAAVLRTELHTIRMNAARGLAQLAATLKGKADPRAKQIEPIVKQLAVGMPAELEGVLEQLDKAMQSGDSATAQTLRAAIQKKSKDWMAFLQTHAHEIHCSENNPWSIAVAIDQPVRASLTAILKATR